MKIFLRAIMLVALCLPSITSSATNNKPFVETFETRWNSQETFKAIHCIALNIYYETRAVSLADAVAVTDVVMNRVKDTRYPNTVCEVIKQAKLDSNGNPKRHKCQFSWYCDGKSDKPTNYEAWERSKTIAMDVFLNETFIGITEGSTHYHANYVTPSWSKQLQRITRVGSHIFYRQK